MSEGNCELKHVCLALLFRYYNAGLNFHTKGLTAQNAMTSRQYFQFTKYAKNDNYTFGKPLGTKTNLIYNHFPLAVTAKLTGVRL